MSVGPRRNLRKPTGLCLGADRGRFTMRTSFLMQTIAAVVIAMPFVSWGESRPAVSPEPTQLFGALQMAPEHAAIGREHGWRVAVVPVSWDRFEPGSGRFDDKYIEGIASKKAELRVLGYKLQLDLGVQYPPAWAFEGPNARYRNQYGATFASKESGENLPNVVFNAAVRERLAGYLHAVFSRLGSDWDFVRLGGGKFGELNYPRPNFEGQKNCYWAFDEFAQGKSTGLPERMRACPVPGLIPGASSADHGSAKKFIEWYLESLRNYQDWQIATIRRWYAGDVCLLYGSWGLRPGWVDAAVAQDLKGDTSPERNGELQQGFDWARMIGAIHDPRAIVYCTWVDGTLANRDLADDESADPARWSPVHWQASLARTHPLHLRVWGENTGQNNLEAMRLTFARAKRFDLMGLMWAFDAELFVKPNPRGYATFEDFTTCIRETGSSSRQP